MAAGRVLWLAELAVLAVQPPAGRVMLSGASLLSPAQHRSEESQLRPGSHTANTSCPLTDCHADFGQIVIWLTEAF